VGNAEPIMYRRYFIVHPVLFAAAVFGGYVSESSLKTDPLKFRAIVMLVFCLIQIEQFWELDEKSVFYVKLIE
jgi:hypothetical protein